MPETFATSCGWVDGKCFRCGRTQPDRHDTSRCPALAPDAREEAERRGALEAVEYAAEDTEAQEDFLTGWRTALRWQAAQQSEPVGKSETHITDEVVRRALSEWFRRMRATLVAALEAEKL